MKWLLPPTQLFSVALIVGFASPNALAQIIVPIVPALPTSADRVLVSLPDQTCGGGLSYIANPYSVALSGSRITVTTGRRAANPVPLCPAAPREVVDLGVLPPGSYTLTVLSSESGTDTLRNLVTDQPFTVTDARAAKVAPYVRLDYSGTWWDASDPGWGLFIWQNAASPRDEVLAAWFTFGSDGRANWYTLQPTWRTSTATQDAPLVQSARPPSNSNPPPGPTNNSSVGTAALDFTTPIGATRFDTAILTYTIGNGTRQTRTIQRFRP
jgi:hypothetical protein